MLIVWMSVIYDFKFVVKGSLISIFLTFKSFTILKLRPYKFNQLNRLSLISALIQIFTV